MSDSDSLDGTLDISLTWICKDVEICTTEILGGDPLSFLKGSPVDSGVSILKAF